MRIPRQDSATLLRYFLSHNDEEENFHNKTRHNCTQLTYARRIRN